MEGLVDRVELALRDEVSLPQLLLLWWVGVVGVLGDLWL